MDKYGGEEHLQAPPKELLLAQSEVYVEYNRKGKVLKGVERAAVKSKYEEDVYPNNHTCVWGSYWKEGHWGFKCCHSFIKNSYCTGEEGKKAQEQSVEFADPEVFKKKSLSTDVDPNQKQDSLSSSSSSTTSSSESDSSSSEDEEEKKRKETEKRVKKTEQNRKKKRAKKQTNKKQIKRRKLLNDDSKKRAEDESDDSTSSSEESADEEEKERKINLRKALIEQAKKEREGEKLREMDERDRPYHSNYETKQLNEYEIEAYKLRKILPNDPMANYFEKGKKK